MHTPSRPPVVAPGTESETARTPRGHGQKEAAVEARPALPSRCRLNDAALPTVPECREQGGERQRTIEPVSECFTAGVEPVNNMLTSNEFVNYL